MTAWAVTRNLFPSRIPDVPTSNGGPVAEIFFTGGASYVVEKVKFWASGIRMNAATTINQINPLHCPSPLLRLLHDEVLPELLENLTGMIRGSLNAFSTEPLPSVMPL